MFRLLVAVAAFVIAAAGAPAHAKTLRYATQGDILTLDPHSQSDGLNLGVNLWVYEPLVRADDDFEPAPALAVSWEQVSPLRLRLKMREGVKFQDGSPFTAEDAAFSIKRALAPTSQYKAYVSGIREAKAIDPLTLEIQLSEPNPVILKQLTVLGMMSKAWAEAHDAVLPQNYAKHEDSYASRHAMGTGPFVLKSREPDVKTVYVENPNWWGKPTKKGNVTEIVYTPIKNGATRTAALLSGELDLVLDPAPQDLDRLSKQLKIVEGNETRTIYIALDQKNEELAYSSVKDANPFKDIRVREALYRAIDIQAIKKNIMKGSSQPTGAMIAPQVHGWTKEMDQRVPFDLNRAKQLMKEAGYEKGFDLTLDCPNDRYINDADICQAIAGMWAKIGVNTKPNAMRRSLFYPKVLKLDTSAYLFGWGVPTFDSYYTLQALVHTVGEGADGEFNYGRYSNPKVDALIDDIKVESNAQKRDDMIHEAFAIFAKEFGSLPLHNQVIPWAMQKNIKLTHRADNRPVMDWIVVE